MQTDQMYRAYRGRNKYSMTNPPPPNKDKNTGEMGTRERFQRILSDLAVLRTDEKYREDDVEEALAFFQEGLTRIAKGESVQGLLGTQQPELEESQIQNLMAQGNFYPPPGYKGIPSEEVARITPGQYGMY